MQRPTDMLTRLGQKWGWVLGYGIITLAAGVAVLVWPGETLLVIAVLFGVQLIVSDQAVPLRLAGVPLVAVTVVLAAWAVQRLRRPVDPEALAAMHRDHFENRLFKKLRDRIGWDDDHPGRT